MRTALSPRLGRRWALVLLTASVATTAGVVPAVAGAETRTTAMPIASSNPTPLVGERIFYSAQFEPRPFEARMSFYDNSVAIPNCTNLYLAQKCWVEYSEPAEHTITATMTSSQEEENEFGFKYELVEAPRPVEVNALARGVGCAGASCTARLMATGSTQTWTVPTGVSHATFVVRGAGGGAGDSNEAQRDEGGSGGKVTATLAVTEGSTLTLVIGEPGILAAESGNEEPGGYGGGGNGGADTWYGGASGGGGSFVFAAEGSLLLLAAGGGGGAGNLAPGGNGGQSGGEGLSNGLPGGTGASFTGPGLGSVGGQNGFGPTETTAIEGRGGTGGAAVAYARSGGGGGGGYYGGGGGGTETWGAVSGGGGGSDYVSPAATGVGYEDGVGGAGGEDTTNPAQPGDIEITYTRSPAASLITVPAPAPPSSDTAQPTPAHHEEITLSPHLTVYTHGGQGVINSRSLTLKMSCGEVACIAQASATLHVRGLSHLPMLLSSPTAIAASSTGTASLPVPKALRRLLRHYLLHHRGIRAKVQLTATASSGDASRETLAETLPTWTLPGLR